MGSLGPDRPSGPADAFSTAPPKFTAMVMSVASPKVGAIGTGFNTPPSMRSMPLRRNGVKKRGKDMEARIASNSLPEFIQISFSPFTSADP